MRTKKTPTGIDSGMFTIISVNLKNKSLPRKQILPDFEKEHANPQMASDQNQSSTIGISMVKNLV